MEKKIKNYNLLSPTFLKLHFYDEKVKQALNKKAVNYEGKE